MPKVFNTTGVCVPEEHYMVNIDDRLKEIKSLVDKGKYFSINKARQYGKTTTLMALSRKLQKEYYVVSMDFQTFGSADFETEKAFSASFANSFSEALEFNELHKTQELDQVLRKMECESREESFTLRILFKYLRLLCIASDKPIVLMIDEVDSATNNQVFIDFLAQLRAQYLKRFQQPCFRSVILAGVYDIRNLRRKIRADEEHKYNSPWNIAADFKVELSFSKDGIAGMLQEYEEEHHTGMNIYEMAERIYEYTEGYPFLVSKLCQLLDEDISQKQKHVSLKTVWNKEGLEEAVRMLLTQGNTLFESLCEKLISYPELNDMLHSILFTGRTVAYNYYEASINIATMFGFVKNKNSTLAISNRIFETWLYNFYLSTAQMQKKDIYKASLQDRNQFIVDGYLNMRRILERFVVHFHEIYGTESEQFLEEEGRQYFLLYLRPIINGTGNYYIEARTRDLRRTDVIVDYHGQQYIIEMKIWHGQEYHSRGEEQLLEYLADYHVDKGYMISFNFNKKKNIGVHEISIGGKTIIEAVV